MSECDLCGNPAPRNASRCPFCHNPLRAAAAPSSGARRVRVCSIKEGRPTVEEARSRLLRLMDAARHSEAKVLIVIHGYGASGKGGAIREEARRLLAGLRAQGRIRAFVPGERWGRGDPAVRQLLNDFPALDGHPELRGQNPGISVVVV